MLPTDLPLLHSLGVPTVSPDGASAVVSLLRPDLETDEYVGGLQLVPLSGTGESPGGPRQLTHGRRDTSPAYSPDGKWIAFLRTTDPGGKGPTSKPQLHLLPTAGGDAVSLTDSPLGVGGPSWSPESKRLVVTARIPEPGRYGTTLDGTGEGASPAAEAPRLITKNQYRIDGTGSCSTGRSTCSSYTSTVGRPRSPMARWTTPPRPGVPTGGPWPSSRPASPTPTTNTAKAYGSATPTAATCARSSRPRWG